MTQDSNTVVASAATQNDVLPTDQLSVLGTLMTPTGPRAILRTSNGHVRTVSVGDRTFNGQVVAIGESRVILNGLVGQTVLDMPSG